MIRLYGHSDDVLVIEAFDAEYKAAGKLWTKEIGCYRGAVRVTIGNRPGEALTNGSTVVVEAEYGDPRDPELSVWRLATRYQAENIPCRWNIAVEPRTAESMEVNVECPGATAVFVERYTGTRWEPVWSTVGNWPC